MLIYTVYRTTNLVNGNIYIGVHKTSDPNDSYLGSGKLISKAVKIYGRENFAKEILFEFDNKSDAYAKEAELVTPDFIKERTNYNIAPGGKGGILWNCDNHPTKGKKHSPQAIKNMSIGSIGQTSGLENYQFKGYYKLPNCDILFETSGKAAEYCGMASSNIRRICKDKLDLKVTPVSYRSNRYITSLGNKENVVGKTHRELGFDFKI